MLISRHRVGNLNLWRNVQSEYDRWACGGYVPSGRMFYFYEAITTTGSQVKCQHKLGHVKLDAAKACIQQEINVAIERDEQ